MGRREVFTGSRPVFVDASPPGLASAFDFGLFYPAGSGSAMILPRALSNTSHAG